MSEPTDSFPEVTEAPKAKPKATKPKAIAPMFFITGEPNVHGRTETFPTSAVLIAELRGALCAETLSGNYIRAITGEEAEAIKAAWSVR